MKEDWIRLCEQTCCAHATYWSGGKKILRGVEFRFPDPFGPLTFEELGYSKTKMALLRKAYLHEESRAVALDQWNNRKNYKPRAHWSTGFTCYNHLVKNHQTGLGSTMGPCLQSVTLTHTMDGVAEIDVFYRTTELFKKFPADLVLLRDHLLRGFDFERTPVAGMTVHIANMTVSPTYAPVLLTLHPDVFRFLETLRRRDGKLHKGMLRWALKLLRGSESKFNQARRTQRAVKRLMADRDQQKLVSYIHNAYPEFLA